MIDFWTVLGCSSPLILVATWAFSRWHHRKEMREYRAALQRLSPYQYEAELEVDQFLKEHSSNA